MATSCCSIDVAGLLAPQTHHKWPEMFEIPRLKTPPTTPAEAIERLEANWKYFGANYALLFFGFVYLVLGYFYPSLLVCVALVLGLQFAESNVLKGKTFAVAGVTIKHYMIEIAVKIVCMLIIWFTDVYGLLLFGGLFAFLLSCGHGAMRAPLKVSATPTPAPQPQKAPEPATTEEESGEEPKEEELKKTE